LLVYVSVILLDLHSFPTRRSSDLILGQLKAADWEELAPAASRRASGPLFPERSARGFPGRPDHSKPGSARPSPAARRGLRPLARSEEHTSELQSRENLVCRLLLEK